MKKFLSIVVAALVLVGACSFFSCSPDKESISQREILKQTNQMMEDAALSQVFHHIKIGKFECNDASERYLLRQLQEAGIINYSVKRYAWWEKENKSVSEPYRVKRESYWYSYYDTEYRWVKKDCYNFEDHYIVDIELTRKGKSLVVEQIPEPKMKVDEDLVQPEINPAEYAWNKKDLSEEWPDIPNPFLKPEPEEEVAEAVEEAVEYEEESYEEEYDENYDAVEEEDAEDEDPIERIEKQQYLDYIAFEESSEEVILQCAEIEAIKARNIQIYDDERGFRKARAEVIISTVDVSNVGRIFMGIEEDLRNMVVVEFDFFEDKGWVFNSESIEDFFDGFDFEDLVEEFVEDSESY